MNLKSKNDATRIASLREEKGSLNLNFNYSRKTRRFSGSTPYYREDYTSRVNHTLNATPAMGDECFPLLSSLLNEVKRTR